MQQGVKGKVPTGFRVRRASAGSGKTFKLVEAYLACCLGSAEPLPFRRILALTFTNKAAQEMKDRVVEELEVLAEDAAASVHAAGLKEETGLDIEELGRRARAMRTALNRHFGELSIMTLDKFVGGLVRGFATDLQLEHDFSIELDSGRLLEAAVDRVLEQMGQDQHLTELLGRFVEDAVEDDRDAKVRRQLLDIGRSVDQEQMLPLLEQLEGWTPERFLDIQNRMRAEVSERRRALIGAAKALSQELAQAGVHDEFTRKWVPEKWLPRLAAGRVDAPSKTLTTGVEEGQWAKKNDASGAAAIAPFQSRLEALAEMEAAMGPTASGRLYRTQVMLSRWLPLVGTLTALRDAHQDVQRDDNVRTLGALNRMIAQVVADSPAPYIFERTGERYAHIFIDEFQDTSVMQWRNLAVAVGETLSHGKLSLVVGDAKQAIYRWRNGDHRQLMALPGFAKEAGETLPEALVDAAGRMNDEKDIQPIEENWRSAPQVVDFNNRLYPALAEGLGEEVAEVYADVAQTPRKSFPGGVEVEVVEADRAEARFGLVCVWMEQRIRAALEDGFAAGDIALLVRTNKEAKRLAEYLLTCDPKIIPFTDESLALGRHPAALAVIHLLEAMEEPEEPAPVLKFLQAWGSIQVEQGHAWNEAAWIEQFHEAHVYDRKDGSQTQGRYGSLRGADLLKALVPGFDGAAWSALPLSEAIGRILRSLELDVHYPAHAESLMELTQDRMAIEFGRSGFLAYWHRKGAQQSIRVLPGPNSVRILTVHKSKGLQYPVVITRFDDQRIHKYDTLISARFSHEDRASFDVPGLVAPLSVFKETAVHDAFELEQTRQRFDALNVAYVCTTRAEVRLHIIIDVQKAEWSGEEVPGTVGRFMARGIEAAVGCDLVSGPWRSDGFEASAPLEQKPEEADVKVKEIDGFRFNGIPDGVIAGRRRDLDRPALGRLSKAAFGTAVHAQLARIASVEDAGRVLNQPWPWSRYSREDWGRITAAVQEVLVHPVMSHWFDGSGTVHNERELVSLKREVVRPDRVVLYDDRVDVIDFKTAVNPSIYQQEKDARQVRGYMQAIAQRDGRAVRGFLFYSAEGRCEEVHLL